MVDFSDPYGHEATIPHSKPSIGPDDIRAVIETLESGLLAGGRRVERFEREIASYIGLRYATAATSGTAALYMLLVALNIGAGHEVVIPAYVCSSLVHAVRLTGAKPVVADSGEDIFHMDAASVKHVLTPASKAVVFPHIFGAAYDIGDIVALGVPVIEDCAMSLGSTLNGRKSGALGSIAAIFSFYATKVIAAGEGGMVASNDEALIGRVRDFAHYADKTDGNARFNFAMTDMTAALGLSQLAKIESFIERRRIIAGRYSKRLAGSNATLPSERSGERHIFYRYVLRIADVEGIRAQLKTRGINAERPVFEPLSRFPGLESSCPRAEEAWQTALSIPLYPALSDQVAGRVIDTAAEMLSFL